MRGMFWAAVAAVSLAAGAAQATQYDLTFTGTIQSATTPGIAVGDTLTLNVYTNNLSTDLNQTWGLSDLDYFTIESGTYTAGYTGFWPAEEFQTNAAGQVTSVNFNGTSLTSIDTDNFGVVTGDIVFSDGYFEDTRYDTDTVNGWNNAAQWTVSAVGGGVPEPASWALMLFGCGALGAGLRRQRKSALAAL
jgi:hypothetical protein